MRVVRHCPDELWMEVLKSLLDGTLSNLIRMKMSLLMPGVALDLYKVPSHPNYFVLMRLGRKMGGKEGRLGCDAVLCPAVRRAADARHLRDRPQPRLGPAHRQDPQPLQDDRQTHVSESRDLISGWRRRFGELCRDGEGENVPVGVEGSCRGLVFDSGRSLGALEAPSLVSRVV